MDYVTGLEETVTNKYSSTEVLRIDEGKRRARDPEIRNRTYNRVLNWV